MSDWNCLVTFPDGRKEVRLIPGPTPSLHALVTITGEPGTWFVEDAMLSGFAHDYIEGTHVHAAVTVRPSTADDEVASPASRNWLT